MAGRSRSEAVSSMSELTLIATKMPKQRVRSCPLCGDHSARKRSALARGQSDLLRCQGCGIGHFLAVAEARGWQGVGVEVSVSALETLRQMKHPVSQTSASQRLRHTIEEVVWLRALKACANGALRILNLGDTLEALAVKREQWRPMSHGGISVTAGQP